MSNSLPEVTRTYINPHLDSTRWRIYTPRANDIVVTTSYKCGTTFTQQILYNMLVRNTFEDEHFPKIDTASPWIDARFHSESLEVVEERLEKMTHRRFLKSHLPLDGLPYFSELKYLIVARDPRDVFMSLVNHYGAYTDLMFKMLEWDGQPQQPRYEGDIKSLWRNWISKGWFTWEQEGYPFWQNMGHTQSYWNYKHLSNFMFLHYGDMIADTPKQIRRIADFIDHSMTDEEVEAVANAVSFKRVKAQAIAETEANKDLPDAFEGGQATFINKGSNGRWRDVLDEEDLQMYRTTRDKVLTPDCATWLEKGGEVR
ncbi:MAG: sulfotransferase domain-containing protein [Pseudomonadales bacterium]|nr:sulfotransferase domain-containing protein [Pseudomonadales bacterium]MBO6564840.1 sulfotransferase domain-containing protein [Pseudomonadales bacterium]MBO6596862.1 sulfotransferase domain-containing protein [Pseudomonadales bacterium]MBO6657947.1 sulfotransferase domain-containing protein [Pseudomonadales bacterium]MBO6703533.1 sulfotransferase domain-containing protein [Pseudomonadales bacterium]